ncbi:hypothetical protein PoB_003531300 [Plakobranchus ocellatus]|uniref:Uncharacterized protein n=1 Tax=Plakobranchus ocellatus TaxID=259542 RepID=A0AAV4APS5_9GAST|nr:hypothetical protein PoB_003531300 [Plakobranchus ocellatus]
MTSTGTGSKLHNTRNASLFRAVCERYFGAHRKQGQVQDGGQKLPSYIAYVCNKQDHGANVEPSAVSSSVLEYDLCQLQ